MNIGLRSWQYRPSEARSVLPRLKYMAGLSYHICGKLEVAFKASPSSQHQHCTDEAQKAETVLSAVSYIYIYIYMYISIYLSIYI